MNMVNFLIYFLIFGLAYGISTQALLYPNEWRTTEIFYGFIYVPYFSIYGELFNSERSTYGHAGDALSPGEDCYNTFGKTVSDAVNETDRIEQRCPNIQLSVEVLQRKDSKASLSSETLFKLDLTVLQFSFRIKDK